MTPQQRAEALVQPYDPQDTLWQVLVAGLRGDFKPRSSSEAVAAIRAAIAAAITAAVDEALAPLQAALHDMDLDGNVERWQEIRARAFLEGAEAMRKAVGAVLLEYFPERGSIQHDVDQIDLSPPEG